MYDVKKTKRDYFVDSIPEESLNQNVEKRNLGQPVVKSKSTAEAYQSNCHFSTLNL